MTTFRLEARLVLLQKNKKVGTIRRLRMMKMKETLPYRASNTPQVKFSSKNKIDNNSKQQRLKNMMIRLMRKRMLLIDLSKRHMTVIGNGFRELISLSV